MKQKMPKYVFEIVSPLQILLSLEIIRNISREAEIHVIVIGGFDGAETVTHKMGSVITDAKSLRYFSTFDRSMDFISIMRPNRIFTHADVGIKKGLQLLWLKAKNPKMAISVYEEGIGTYRDDLYRGLKKTIFPLLGFGTYFGGHALTSEIHVMDPPLYKRRFPRSSKKIIQIPGSPITNINNNKKAIYKLFNYNRIENSGNKCIVYLSSWTVDMEFYRSLSRENCDVYFKPHPRLNFSSMDSSIYNLPSSVPAEVVLSDLSENYHKITVYHHGSSAEWYCNTSKITFIKIPTKSPPLVRNTQ